MSPGRRRLAGKLPDPTVECVRSNSFPDLLARDSSQSEIWDQIAYFVGWHDIPIHTVAPSLSAI
jgi:hypothetical protein